VRAAEASGRLFVCEDHLLRNMAQLKFDVRGTWLQPILMVALAKRKITAEAYLQAVLGFIHFRLGFISIDSGLLVAAALKAEGHALPVEFTTLASRIGGKGADLMSHVSVSIKAAGSIWINDTLSPVLRCAVVGALLERFAVDQSLEHFRWVIIQFYQACGDLREFRAYIRDWLRGHFISFS
jgi:hypothetical protein